MNNLGSRESKTIILSRKFIKSLPRYGTKMVAGKDGKTYLVTSNSNDGKFAVVPIEAIKGVGGDWKDGDYIPMKEFSPEDLCCEILQGDKDKYYAAFVFPRKIFNVINTNSWKVKWVDKTEACFLYKKLI